MLYDMYTETQMVGLIWQTDYAPGDLLVTATVLFCSVLFCPLLSCPALSCSAWFHRYPVILLAYPFLYIHTYSMYMYAVCRYVYALLSFRTSAIAPKASQFLVSTRQIDN